MYDKNTYITPSLIVSIHIYRQLFPAPLAFQNLHTRLVSNVKTETYVPTTVISTEKVNKLKVYVFRNFHLKRNDSILPQLSMRRQLGKQISWKRRLPQKNVNI